jgi:hypothetical protein
MTNQSILQTKPLVTQAQPKGLLYHYTDQKGLIGILESKKIWATHARYLNDTTEGKIVVEVLRKVINDIPGNSTLQDRRKAMKKFQAGLKEFVAGLNMFVTSFSEDGNRLSQWRAYSGMNGGYSIGFRAPYLREAGTAFLEKNNGWLRPDQNPLKRCRYSDENAKQSAPLLPQQGKSESIDSVSSEGCNPASESKAAFVAQTTQSDKDIFSAVLDLVASLKHKGFEEEKEWRIALFIKERTNPDVLKFRPGNSMPAPYIEIDLQPNSRWMRVEEIIVGPCPNPKEAAQSVELLLRSNDCHSVRVIPSGIPYRNW